MGKRLDKNHRRDADWKRVGEIVRERRKALHYTQRDLMTRTGLSMGSITRIETGHPTNRSTLRTIARAIGIGVSSLFDAAGIPIDQTDSAEQPDRDVVDTLRKLLMLDALQREGVLSELPRHHAITLAQIFLAHAAPSPDLRLGPRLTGQVDTRPGRSTD